MSFELIMFYVFATVLVGAGIGVITMKDLVEELFGELGSW